MTCPQCTSSDIRRSHGSGWGGVLQNVRGRQAFRCRKCRHRFFALPSTQLAGNDSGQPGSKIQPDPIGKRRKMRRLFRRIISVAVLVVVFSLFGLFLRYISVDHVPKPAEDDPYTSTQ